MRPIKRSLNTHPEIMQRVGKHFLLNSVTICYIRFRSAMSFAFTKTLSIRAQLSSMIMHPKQKHKIDHYAKKTALSNPLEDKIKKLMIL